MAYDVKKTLWISTSKGLFYIPFDSDTPLKAEATKDNVFIKIICGSNDDIWLIANKLLYRYNTQSEQINQYEFPKIEGDYIQFGMYLAMDNEENLWIAAFQGGCADSIH